MTGVQSETEKVADNDLNSFEPAWGFSFFKTGLKMIFQNIELFRKKIDHPLPRLRNLDFKVRTLVFGMNFMVLMVFQRSIMAGTYFSMS